MKYLVIAVTLCTVLSANTSSNEVPQQLRGIGIDQKLNQQIPLDAMFKDEYGRNVRLGDYFGKKPVVLGLVYYECPMLCNLTLNGMLRSLRAVNLNIGKEYDVLNVSFNPREGPELAADKKEAYSRRYGREGVRNGWHFLTGNEENIRKLADAVGFHYRFDEKSGQYVHASGIMIVTPEGRLSHYFYGIEFPPRDVKFGLMQASNNRIGSPVDQLLLYCYHYDPETGKYGLIIMNTIRIAGGLTVAGLVLMLVVLSRRNRRRKLENARTFPVLP